MKRTIKLIVYYFLYQILASFIVILAYSIGSIKGILSGTVDMTSLSTKTEVLSWTMVLATLAMLVHLVHYRYVEVGKGFFTAVKGKILLLCLPLVFSAMFVLNTLMEALNLPNTMEDSFVGMSHNFFGALSITVLAPILEEFLFRGAIEGHLLRKWKNPWAAIVVSALVFGIIHLNPAQIPFAFLIGLIFGWLYYRTGSVLPGILGHILNNSIATGTMFFFGDATTAEFLGGESLLYGVVAVMAVVFLITVVWLNKLMPRQTYYRPDVVAEATEETKELPEEPQA